MIHRPHDFPIDRPAAAQDFDFLFGRWRVHNRRLWQRLCACDDWEEFGASLEVRPVLGGLGNVDQFRTVLGERYFEGMSVRLFNLATEEWAIYWSDTERGELLEPLKGGFSSGIGSFSGRETHEGESVAVRFLWQSLEPHLARWEQAYSADDGATWETNWIMELKRD